MACFPPVDCELSFNDNHCSWYLLKTVLSVSFANRCFKGLDSSVQQLFRIVLLFYHFSNKAAKGKFAQLVSIGTALNPRPYHKHCPICFLAEVEDLCYSHCHTTVPNRMPVTGRCSDDADRFWVKQKWQGHEHIFCYQLMSDFSAMKKKRELEQSFLWLIVLSVLCHLCFSLTLPSF